MSVTIEFFTVYGVKIPYTDAVEKRIQQLHETEQTRLDIIVDTLSLGYVILGKILYRSGTNDEGFNGNIMTCFEKSYINQVEKLVNKELRTNFSDCYSGKVEFKIISFSHYS